MNEILYDPKMSADWLLKFVVFVLLYVCCVVVVVSSYSEQHGLSCTVLGLVNRYESTKFDRPCSTGSLHWNFWHAIKHFFLPIQKYTHTHTPGLMVLDIPHAEEPCNYLILFGTFIWFLFNYMMCFCVYSSPSHPIPFHYNHS